MIDRKLIVMAVLSAMTVGCGDSKDVFLKNTGTAASGGAESASSGTAERSSMVDEESLAQRGVDISSMKFFEDFAKTWAASETTKTGAEK